MRGRQRTVVAAVLLLALAVAATAAGSSAHILFRAFSFDVRLRIGWLCVPLFVGLDALGVKPLAAHRQVPQWWGHERGPLAAAARYGLRMGIGPLTILTSWLWWLGFIGGAVTLSTAVVSALFFAFGRFATMVALALGSPTGVAMSKRVGRISAFSGKVRWSSLIILVFIASALYVASHL